MRDGLARRARGTLGMKLETRSLKPEAQSGEVAGTRTRRKKEYRECASSKNGEHTTNKKGLHITISKWWKII